LKGRGATGRSELEQSYRSCPYILPPGALLDSFLQVSHARADGGRGRRGRGSLRGRAAAKVGRAARPAGVVVRELVVGSGVVRRRVTVVAVATFVVAATFAVVVAVAVAAAFLLSLGVGS